LSILLLILLWIDFRRLALLACLFSPLTLR